MILVRDQFGQRAKRFLSVAARKNLRLAVLIDLVVYGSLGFPDTDSNRLVRFNGIDGKSDRSGLRELLACGV